MHFDFGDNNMYMAGMERSKKGPRFEERYGKDGVRS
jgi:hypothetical protein